ncbi:hypothetical protein LWF01_11120 [Saxibacter everestensis]|uniref:CobQ/CobB/MinD/ParA nucleotide binding domain-containing protein n=1 Tax=Saxibacter everestensis TaxID=2909229 RepID=A0ABY8QP16_9MICO|nr:hypothetical protein LWF01_11120 [Brevibacteriaceae bacterium ZFBP1038]
MSIPVLVAIGGSSESEFVAELANHRDLATVVRRPADVVELIAAAESGQGRAAVISDHFPDIDRDVVQRLRRLGLVVIALSAEPGRMMALGVSSCLTPEAPAAQVARAIVREYGKEAGGAGAPEEQPGVATESGPAVAPAVPLGPGPARNPAQRSGTVVAVWGGAGSPGRTTLSINLAAELAGLGATTMLIDSDTYAASIAPALGMLDDAPSLAAACRLAGRGMLTPRTHCATSAPKSSPICGC